MVQMMLLAVTMVFVFLVELLMAVAIKRICCPEFKGTPGPNPACALT